MEQGLAIIRKHVDIKPSFKHTSISQNCHLNKKDHASGGGDWRCSQFIALVMFCVETVGPTKILNSGFDMGVYSKP